MNVDLIYIFIYCQSDLFSYVADQSTSLRYLCNLTFRLFEGYFHQWSHFLATRNIYRHRNWYDHVSFHYSIRYSKFYHGDRWRRVSVHNIKLGFNIYKPIALHKQIFGDSLILDFLHFHPNSIASNHWDTCQTITERLKWLDNCDECMHKDIPQPFRPTLVVILSVLFIY